MMIKNLIVVGGVIAIAIIAFYFIGIGPTNLELGYDDGSYEGPGMNKNITTLNISGTTEPYATVTVNGENVPVDKNGSFYKIVPVPTGTTIYHLNAKAPFKSTNQINVTTNRIENSDGSVSGNWRWNGTTMTNGY